MSIKWEGEGTTQERTILIETPINEVRQERVRLRDLRDLKRALKNDKLNAQNLVADITTQIKAVTAKINEIKLALGLTSEDIADL